VFDRDYFERCYRDYDRQNPRGKLTFYSRLASQAAAGADAPRILDIGCAMGLFLSTLGTTWRKFGVDASEYAISNARGRVPEADFRVARGADLFFDVKFDVITAFDVLEHLEDPLAVVGRIAELLKPGGGWVFVVPVYDGPTGPIIRLLDRDPTHLQKHGRNYWLELPGCDFELVDWWGIYRYLIPLGPYLHIVTRRLRRFTPAIACLYRRLGEPSFDGPKYARTRVVTRKS
jgi:SAM-dependent methyltransferase